MIIKARYSINVGYNFPVFKHPSLGLLSLYANGWIFYNQLNPVLYDFYRKIKERK